MPYTTRSTTSSLSTAGTKYAYSCCTSAVKKKVQRRYEARLMHITTASRVSSLIAYGTVRGRTITITSLYTVSAKRHKGLASKLLRFYISECLKNGYHTFLLDDCSEYFRQNDKNIYYKQGFRYRNDGEPEMKLSYR
jgi:predicted GNAT family acetyltransferase